MKEKKEKIVGNIHSIDEKNRYSQDIVDKKIKPIILTLINNINWEEKDKLLYDGTGRREVLYTLPNQTKYRTLESGKFNGKDIMISLHGVLPGPEVFSNQQSDKNFDNILNIALDLHLDKYVPEYRNQKQVYTKENFEELFSNYIYQFVNLLKEKYKIEKIHIEGVSAGGYIASSFASKYPESIQSMILSGASGYNEEMPDVKINKRQLFVNAAKYMITKKIPPLLREYVLNTFIQKDNVSEEIIEKTVDIAAKVITRKDASRGKIKNIMGSPDANRSDEIFYEIGKNNIPVTIINGQEDDITPREGQEKIALQFLKRGNNISENLVGGGHAPYIENAPIYNELRKEHLDKNKISNIISNGDVLI